VAWDQQTMEHVGHERRKASAQTGSEAAAGKIECAARKARVDRVAHMADDDADIARRSNGEDMTSRLCVRCDVLSPFASSI
jgi:hypothetical protein